MNLYDIPLKTADGSETSLSAYKGKVMLIVNTATKCGLTPQYEALQSLYDTYKDQGLVVLDFPCNQFLEQAPGTDEAIGEFCSLNFGTTFPRFAKTDVNGPDAHPLFTYLKEQAPTDRGDETTAAFEAKVKDFTPGLATSDIKWNFGKFLIDREGGVAARYSPAYPPENLKADIEALL